MNTFLSVKAPRFYGKIPFCSINYFILNSFSMRTLIALFFLLFGTFCYSQEEIEAKLEQVRIELSSLQSHNGMESANFFSRSIDTINQEIIRLTTLLNGQNRNSQINEIDSLRSRIGGLEEKFQFAVQREEQIGELNRTVHGLSSEIIAFRKYKELTEEQNQESTRLQATADSLNNLIIFSQVQLFAGNVEQGKTAYQNFATLSVAAEGIIIFDEPNNKKIWKIIKSGGLGGLSLTAGGFSLNSFQNEKNGEGALYLGLGLGLQVLQSSIKDKSYLESITRNVAFSDELRSLSKIAVPLNNESNKLFSSIPNNPFGLINYFPDKADLDSYFKIIDYNKQIQLQFYQLQLKAENLLAIGDLLGNLSVKGRAFLTNIVQYCKDSASSWSEIEPSYRERYRLLLEELNRREISMN